jgi:glycerophosphoryl diester phosphodiesterase
VPGRTRPLVVAHRGASASAPENTLPAVRLAVAMRVDLVEVDVQLTGDGHLVVVHDTTLARTTDVARRLPGRAPWRVAEHTLAEVRGLDAGSWFSPTYAGVRVPTLHEVLTSLRGGTGLLLEVKAPAEHPGIAEALATALDGWPPVRAQGTPRVVVQSFDPDFMERFHALAPEVPAGLLVEHPDELPGPLPGWAEQLNPCHSHVTAASVRAAHDRGAITLPFTVDDPDRMRALLALGVDGLITNRPDVLLDLLGRSAARAA